VTKELYIAGPMGFSEAGRDFMYNRLMPAIKETGFSIIDPWKLTPQEQIDKILAMHLSPEKQKALADMNRKIGSKNEEGIRRAFGIVSMLDGPDVDSGTAGEIGFCYGLGKSVLGYRNDFRLSSENIGAKVNIQVEYFILNSPGGEIISSISELPSALTRIFGTP